eukprot:jgi/Mesen1/4088/ME000214S03269
MQLYSNTRAHNTWVDACYCCCWRRQVCSVLHQRYRDFAPTLVPCLLKALAPPPATPALKVGGAGPVSGGGGDDAPDGVAGGSAGSAARKRITLRLLTELFLCGIVSDVAVLMGVLKELTAADTLQSKDKDRDAAHTSLALVVSFVRHARILLGFPCDPVQELAYGDLSVSHEQKKAMLKMVCAFYDAALALLLSEHAALEEQGQENARMLHVRGELTDEHAATYERLRKSYDQLLRNVTSLAELLDKEPPVMPADDSVTRMSGPANGSAGSAADHGALSTPEPLWDDDDTRTFYENLPDLRAFVPAVLLGDTEVHKGGVDVGSSSSAKEQLHESGHVAEDTSSAATPTGTLVEGEKEAEGDAVVKDAGAEATAAAAGGGGGEGERALKGADAASLDSVLQRLPSCVSRDLIDQITVEFCYLNSKGSRRKLVRALFGVPRTALELLPYYSRMVATLSLCIKDIAPHLVQMLEEEFHFLLNKKDQINIESKIKNARFLGELAKFKVASPGLIFNCLKACLDDFRHHSIDMACALLETCGRYLYRTPQARVRMGNMLDIMVRLKNARNLDARHTTLVDNAYYMCRPPERSAQKIKIHPPLHQYMKKLLIADLERSSIERVLRQLRKLPWADCEAYMRKWLRRIDKWRYSQVHLAASLTAGLSRHHDAFTVAVIDQVLEDVRVGLEMNEYSLQQRRLSQLRFLGELYNYRLIESPVIFDTLYLILFYGYGTPEQERLDPAEDSFRVRMVVALLETCGQFFDRGSSKRRLNRFLLYLQRYVLAKPTLPLDVEFDLQDMFAELRPRMVRYNTFEEAHAAVLELEHQEQAALLATQGPPGGASRGPTHTLAPVPEEDQALHSRANGATGREDADSDSEGESGASMVDGHDEEDEEDERNRGEDSDDEDDEVAGEDDDSRSLTANDDDDDTVRVRQQQRTVDPEEEAAFEKELRAVMQESIAERKLEKRPGPSLNMAVLVKKGSKQTARQLVLPRDSALALVSRQKEAEEAQEKEDIKRRVLELNERAEDEKLLHPAALLQPIMPMNHHHHHHHRNAAAQTGLLGAASQIGSGPRRVAAAAKDGPAGRFNSRQRRPVAAGAYTRRR